MALTALYMRKGGAEDMFLDADTHSVPVSSTTNRNVTGLAAYFLRIDGSSTGTGDWLTTGKMTASYFIATHASTYSELPRLLANTTLRVVSAAVLEVDATSLDCGVASNFTAAVAMTAGLTSNTGVFGTDPTGSEVLRAASARLTTLIVNGTSTLTGNVVASAQLAVGGNVSLAGNLAVNGTTALTGALTLSGGGTVPSGQTLTIAAGATLTVSGTLGTVASLLATAATVGGASGGSEALRTTTFRATGASVFTNTVTMSSSLSVASTITLASASVSGDISITSTGGLANTGTANYFELPAGGDTGTGASIDFDALDTKNSHQFNPSGNRSITSIAGTRKGLYWFVNIHATSTVTFADALVAYPSGSTFVMAANSTALVYWDNTTLTVVCAYS